MVVAGAVLGKCIYLFAVTSFFQGTVLDSDLLSYRCFMLSNHYLLFTKKLIILGMGL